MSNRKKNVIGNRRNPLPKKSSREKNKGQATSRKQKKIDKRVITPVSIDTSSTRKRSPRRRRNNFLKGFSKSLIIGILILVVSGVLINTLFLSNVNAGLTRNFNAYGISKKAAAFAKDHKIVNIAVFGVDAREDVDGARTDTIMIATADYENNKIKVSSLMRDTYVYINEKYKFDKLNSAYAYGGADLALKTINQNFDTAITDFITIDFDAMVTMVNAVGGVTIEIESYDELEWVNAYLDDVNEKVKTGTPHLDDIGSQLVDGSQALAYCRVRYVGDGDFDRTLRQRIVFEQALSKALNLKAFEQFTLLRESLPYIETSLSTLEFIKYGINFMMMPSREIAQSRFPVDDFMLLDYLGDVSYIVPNELTDNIKALYQFVYEIDYLPSDDATEISDSIDDTVNGSFEEYDPIEEYDSSIEYDSSNDYNEYDSSRGDDSSNEYDYNSSD